MINFFRRVLGERVLYWSQRWHHAAIFSAKVRVFSPINYNPITRCDVTDRNCTAADRQQESVSLRIVIIVVEDTRRPKQDEDDNGDNGDDVYLYIMMNCVFVGL